MAKFFRYIFGEDGDRTAIPETTQPSGAVSYQEGFGFDYERELGVDPLAKAVPRDESNQLYYDITDAIRQYQTQSIPDFIEASENGGVNYPYPKDARVRYYDGVSTDIYTSLIDSNDSLPTDNTKWRKGDNGITNLTGDVVADGPGSVPATIQANAVTTSKIAAQAVTLPKMENRGANIILGNPTNATGQLQEITVNPSTLVGRASTGNIAGITIGTGLALTGTVLSNPGAAIAANSFLANATAGSAVPSALTLSAIKHLVGRGATGNLAQISLGDFLDMTGAVLDVVGESNTGTSGYFKVPGTPFVIQYGVRNNVGTGGSGVNITFPIEFPSACVGVFMNNIYTGTIQAVPSLGGAPTVSGFNMRMAAGSNSITVPSVYWFAIGY